MVEELEMAERFDAELYIPPITSLRALSTVLDEVQLLEDDRERNQVMSDIEVAFRPVTRDEMALYEETKLSIGVKKLLNLTEMARLDPEQVGGRFVSSLIEQSRGAATVPRARRRNVPPSEQEEISSGYYPGVM
jgi:vesicle-fusing ATPase